MEKVIDWVKRNPWIAGLVLVAAVLVFLAFRSRGSSNASVAAPYDPENDPQVIAAQLAAGTQTSLASIGAGVQRAGIDANLQSSLAAIAANEGLGYAEFEVVLEEIAARTETTLAGFETQIALVSENNSLIRDIVMGKAEPDYSEYTSLDGLTQTSTGQYVNQYGYDLGWRPDLAVRINQALIKANRDPLEGFGEGQARARGSSSIDMAIIQNEEKSYSGPYAQP